VYQLYSGVDSDDYFLDEMTQPWSGARTLQFDTEVLIVPPPRATLGCLLSFARNCPVLETLGIRMDSTHVPEFTQEPGDRLEGLVGYLHIGTSRIYTVKEGAVAAFISNVFPALEGVYMFESETQLLPEPLEAYAASWRRVAVLVPVFASVRTQEKFWSVEVDDAEKSEGDGVNLPSDLLRRQFSILDDLEAFRLRKNVHWNHWWLARFFTYCFEYSSQISGRVVFITCLT
jgi:hypothetical protein